MTKLDDIDLKLSLEKYLILNNEHKIISFTYFGKSYDFRTIDLVEYSTHSLGLILMVYSAINFWINHLYLGKWELALIIMKNDTF